MVDHLPCVVIVKALVQTDVNRVWEAMGRGPGNISVPLCAIDPEATYQTPPTHYVMQDNSATDADEAVWKSMANNGDLPPIAGVWGEGGIIDAASAQAAISGGNMQVYSAAGLDSSEARTAWREGVITGAGLQRLPDSPV